MNLRYEPCVTDMTLFCSTDGIKSSEVSRGSDSDGNSSDSSEEDLDSPRVIRQAPTSTTASLPTSTANAENMDVDSSGMIYKYSIF